jgi:DNA-binding MarR family transcriptional regulator
MDEQGLIARSPHPRHPNVLELRLTDVGREALHNARLLVAPVEQRVDEAITDEDAMVLVELLTRVIAATDPDEDARGR